MKTWRSASIAMILMCCGAACTKAPATIGVVDIEQAYQRSPLAMASAVRLNAEFAATGNDIKSRGRDLAALHQRLNADLPAEERREVESRIASETAELTALQSRYRRDLQAAQQREGEAMVERVRTIAREIARREGLTVLVEKDAVLYPDSSTAAYRDITELVIRALLDQMNPTEIPGRSDATER